MRFDIIDIGRNQSSVAVNGGGIHEAVASVGSPVPRCNLN